MTSPKAVNSGQTEREAFTYHGVCGTCLEKIRDDPLTGTHCRCTQARAAAPQGLADEQVTVAQMGHGTVAVGGCFSPEANAPGIIYMALDEPREINADTTDVYPIGTRAKNVLAFVTFANAAAVDQTIGILQELKAEYFAEQSAAPMAALPKGYAVKRVEGHGWVIDPPSGSRWIAYEGTPAGDLMQALAALPRASEAVTVDMLSALLPGPYYMDAPDGGSVTLIEQLQRMAHDAKRYRCLRNCYTERERMDVVNQWDGAMDDSLDAAIAKDSK